MRSLRRNSTDVSTNRPIQPGLNLHACQHVRAIGKKENMISVDTEKGAHMPSCKWLSSLALPPTPTTANYRDEALEKLAQARTRRRYEGTCIIPTHCLIYVEHSSPHPRHVAAPDQNLRISTNHGKTRVEAFACSAFSTFDHTEERIRAWDNFVHIKTSGQLTRE